MTPKRINQVWDKPKQSANQDHNYKSGVPKKGHQRMKYWSKGEIVLL